MGIQGNITHLSSTGGPVMSASEKRSCTALGFEEKHRNRYEYTADTASRAPGLTLMPSAFSTVSRAVRNSNTFFLVDE